MHLHILGICGTFMAGVALLARHGGHRVTGSDQEFYPPMSDVLAGAGIETHRGYDPAPLDPPPDLVLIGNALSRGNPAVEHVLDRGLDYTSGPAWLAEHVLRGREVIAVAGTHGKTTTSSILAWILSEAGLEPGFLIGGVPANFAESARAGEGAAFVIEADEYDTAFFDKRSKFVHYRPRILLLNNLEYDHADIFPDLAAIQTQFHHLVRTVPGNGLIVCPAGDRSLDEVLARGCWTPVLAVGTPGGALTARLEDPAGTAFTVSDAGGGETRVEWDLLGAHNVRNALGALAAARHEGVSLTAGARALATFRGVRRRLELAGSAGGVRVYDDFAHHPSAIAAVLDAMRAAHPGARIAALLEPRSNTMRMGVHADTLATALEPADAVWAYEPPALGWGLAESLAPLGARARRCRDVGRLVEEVAGWARAGDHVVVMSNGSFEGIHRRLLAALSHPGGPR